MSEQEPQDGQVSEVQRLDDSASDTPISPEESVAGYPESESGEPDTRGTGPDGVPPENRRDDEHAGSERGRGPGEGLDFG